MSITAGGAASKGGLPPSIGRYRVVERIGKGAMGMVYAAVDEELGRQVAIKVMMADLEDEPEIRERFDREARITGQLAHRNIVTILEFGEDGRHPFIVMELLDGVPLIDYLRTPAAESLDAKIDLMMQVCEGLQVAHARGVIHRDIKPSNLFVQRDGTLKILDFGVARLAESSLTANGFVLGTPEYMSPEQAQGHQVDARSDIFSAASVFYYMLAGRSPFASPELPKMLHAVVHDSPAALNEADAPEPLQRVLMKALAKAPADRYQECAELLADLDRVRRSYEGATHRIAQAALDRYRQISVLIEERRSLGRAAGIPDIDDSCDDAQTRLAARFPDFAKQADPAALMVPMDRMVATDALTALQTRHNSELAAVTALREESADSLRSHAGSAEPEAPDSFWDRAAKLWRRGTPGT